MSIGLQRLTRASAFAHAATRMVLGIVFLVRPDALPRPWIGSTSTEPAAGVAVAAFGVRDVILGAVQIQTLLQRGDARSLFRWGLAAEIVDLGAALRAQREGAGTDPRLMNAITAFGLAGGVYLAYALERSPREESEVIIADDGLPVLTSDGR